MKEEKEREEKKNTNQGGLLPIFLPIGVEFLIFLN
jgi:hypothetical protein